MATETLNPRTWLYPTPRGLYCEPGDFYIDPWQSVPRAVITHAHGDHARPGSRSYLAAKEGDAILRLRLGSEFEYQFIEYGEKISLGSVQVSLHPAGHMTGSSQVRIEHRGEVVNARLCRANGELVYLLTVVGRRGKVARARIEAATGHVVQGR